MKNWIKRHPIKTICLSVLAVPFLLGGLNYSGMCIPQGRWLSDEERIRLAVEAINNAGPNIDYLPPEKSGAIFQEYKPIRYDNASDFLDKNLHCCTVLSPTEKKAMWPYSYESRLIGQRGNVIEVKYTARFADQKNASQEINNYTEYPVITNCGKIIHLTSY